MSKPTLRVIPGGRRPTTEEKFKHALKANTPALAEIKNARDQISHAQYGKQQRLLWRARSGIKPRRPLPAGAVADAVVADDGSIILVRPDSEAAHQWIRQHVSEESQWFGCALVVERRYIADLVAGMESAGLVVE